MKKEGFTLVELMIVVAVIGVLSAIAIPSFLRFIKKSKTSEAPINIRALVNGSLSWYHSEHADTAGNPMYKHFPNSKSPSEYGPQAPSFEANMNPTSTACGSGTGALHAKNTQRWNSQPWLSLKFSITKAHYFMYIYTVTGSSSFGDAEAYIGAGADLDCDGTMSSYNLFLTIGPNNNSQTEIYVTDPLE